MPHKRNPVLSENVTGLARIVRAYVTPALENVVLWHERDISHSSVERMIGPDATGTLDFALTRLASIVDKLVVYPANMQKNLDMLGGLVHSQRVMIALTQKGVAREEAYAMVQRNAMKVWQGEGDFCRSSRPTRTSASISARRSSRRISTSTITSGTSTPSSSGCSARCLIGPAPTLRSAPARSRQGAHELPHGGVEFPRALPVHETARAGNRRRLTKVLHAGQDLRLVGIRIVRAAHAEHR